MLTFKVLFCVFVFAGSQHLFTFASSPTLKARRCFDCVSIGSCETAFNFFKFIYYGILPRSEEYRLHDAFCGFDGYKLKVCCSDFPMGKLKVRILQESSEEVCRRDSQKNSDEVSRRDSQENSDEVSRRDSQENSDEVSIEKHRNFGLLTDDCGRLHGTRITYGSIARLYEFPWMVLILYNTSVGTKFLCGGSIINSRYILTAAHCTVNSNTGELRKIVGVRIGELDYATDIDCQGNGANKICETTDSIQDIEVEDKIPHEKFIEQRPENDIALLRLSEPIIPSKNAAPICLPVYGELRKRNLMGLTATVAGWGATETKTESTILMKAEIPISKRGECYSNNDNGTENYKILCAGGGTRDTCRGDSGGPLMIESDFNGYQRLVQYGIVSQGPRHCGSQDPGVYTDVTKYMNWILDHIKE